MRPLHGVLGAEYYVIHLGACPTVGIDMKQQRLSCQFSHFANQLV